MWWGRRALGKSRVSREIAAIAAARGVDVFTTYCESHATDIPFFVVARLLRAFTGVGDLGGSDARTQVRARLPDADPADLLLFDDLVGIADPEVELPKIDPGCPAAAVDGASQCRVVGATQPALYIVEDAHWIDEVSESMLADFFAVIPQSPSIVLLTYRPEYRGALSSGCLVPRPSLLRR